MRLTARLVALAGLFTIAAAPAGGNAAVPALRLYVMDCGTIHVADPARFNLKRSDVAALDFNCGCYLIVHPKGVLLWDAGTVTDGNWQADGDSTVVHLVVSDSVRRDVTMRRTLHAQLAAAGFTPASVKFFALSHDHYDHTANANAFAHATWLVRPIERDAMFASPSPPYTMPATYEKLRTSKTVLITTDQYDVFGDGSVVILSAPGHTIGHQMLFVKLAQTGPVLLSGDLYHYPEEMTLDRVPTIDYDTLQTRASRKAIADFMRRTGAQLWIQHDLLGAAKLKKSPEFYR